MAILDAHGFDDNTTGTMTLNAVSLAAPSTVQFRTGTRSLRLRTSGTGGASDATHNFGQSLASGFIYFAFYCEGLLNSTYEFFDLMDNGTVHLRLRIRADGLIELFRGPSTTSLAVGSYVVTQAAWHQFAIKWLIADASGTFELRINGSGSPDINFTGDTRNAANASCSQALWRSENSWSLDSVYIDDLVLQDTTGSAPENTWLGDVGCEYAFPNGTVSNDFALTGAGTAHEALDEVPPDDGTTTVDSDTAGDRVILDFDNLVITSGAIFAAVHVQRAIKSAAGPREIESRNILGATEVDGNTHVLSTSWARYIHIYHRDPDGNTWTGTNFNSAKWGTEVTL